METPWSLAMVSRGPNTLKPRSMSKYGNQGLRSPYLVPSGALSRDRYLPDEEAARERAPGKDAEPEVEARRCDVGLKVAVDKAVVHLRGDELRPAVGAANAVGLGDLPGGEVGQSYVAYLAGFHHPVQRVHGLLKGNGGVPSMYLVSVSYTHLRAHETRHDLVC